MGRARKVDTATEADWSFLENDVAIEAIRLAVVMARNDFPGVIDVNDAQQEAHLWLAVRPEQIKGTAKQMALRIYKGALRYRLRGERALQAKLEELMEGDEPIV